MRIICFFLLSCFALNPFNPINALEQAPPPMPAKTVEVPMRDGVKLLMDLYYPINGRLEQSPCILLRSPAGRKSIYALHYAGYAACGYVVAIQDTRSAADPDGKTFPGLSDGWGALQDGFDTVEWLAASPYCNGKIGTAGVSAIGIMQYLLAPSAPPSLKCQHIGVAASSLYHHAIFPGGQLLKDQVEGWLGLYAKDTGVHAFAYTHPFDHPYWDDLNAVDQAENVKTPALHYGGWYDTFLQGTIDGFISRQEKGGEGAKGQQKLIIGPWTHYWPASTRLGDFNVPALGMQPPVDMSCLAWFDYHLKGISNGVEQMPSVTYYVMGAFDGSHKSGNFWRQAESWPPKSVSTPFYLTANGSLSLEKSKRKSKEISYLYNPLDPVPTVGGRNLFIDSGPKDQQEIERRKDVIVFTSDPLQEDLEVTGDVQALLYFSSDCADTDVVLRLTDVYPDGRSILITDGMFRTGFKMLKEGHDSAAPVKLNIDLSATSIVFAKGHRIRLSISSSNYPKYERNYNLGLVGAHNGKFAVARNGVHMGENYPSQIVLPVVSSIP